MNMSIPVWFSTNLDSEFLSFSRFGSSPGCLLPLGEHSGLQGNSVAKFLTLSLLDAVSASRGAVHTLQVPQLCVPQLFSPGLPLGPKTSWMGPLKKCPRQASKHPNHTLLSVIIVSTVTPKSFPWPATTENFSYPLTRTQSFSGVSQLQVLQASKIPGLTWMIAEALRIYISVNMSHHNAVSVEATGPTRKDASCEIRLNWVQIHSTHP